MRINQMRYYVLFTSSFRYEAAPNISHETDATTSSTTAKTYCGRKVSDAATFEPDDNDLDPDCITCRRVAHKRKTIANTAQPIGDGHGGRE